MKVSEEFKLHPSTISKMFKNSTGYKFLDYINRNRIEKAKELMDSTSDEIYNISEKVGYLNYTSFSRVFSRYTGISPIEYKNLSVSNHHKTK
jgi:YesN/AraC family two-component response regulator